jgi:DHA1 family tetracycline resistance protein-like MFS transporter
MAGPEPLAYERPTPAEPPKGALRIIFLIVFMDLLGFGIIIPLLPFYIKGYEENALKVTLLFSVYSICQFVGAPILGMLSDRYGRKPVLTLSQVGSAAGYVLLAMATQVQWGSETIVLAIVYASRVIDGFTGGNISTAQAYVSDVTTPENRAKGMGVLGAAFGIGFTLGPAVGGILGHFDPSLPAYFAAGFSLVAALLTQLKLPESRPAAPAEAEAWLHPSRFGPIVRRPVLMQLLAISFCAMAAFVMMESTVALFLAKEQPAGFGFGKLGVGAFFAFAGLVISVVQGGLIGRLTKRFGDWPLAIAGPMLVAVGMALFTATAWHAWLPLLLLAGAFNATGRSLQQPTVSSLISKFSDPRDHGAVFGLYHGLLSLARVAGPLVAGLAYHWLRNTGQFIVAAAIVIAMSLWTLMLRQPAPHEAREEAKAEAALEPG